MRKVVLGLGYEKALTLDPNNLNAKEKIEKLQETPKN
jgi:hypothetical protein